MMAEIPPGKGSDWEEREAWVLNPPSMSDRVIPSAPGGTFAVQPVDDISEEVPRNASADHATRDVYNLVPVGGTPSVSPIEPETRPEEPSSWAVCTRHSELDGYVGSPQPEGWATMNIAEKKAWLDENYDE